MQNIGGAAAAAHTSKRSADVSLLTGTGPAPAYVPVATRRSSALARPAAYVAGLGPGQRAAQFRS
jgi:hypothetical protein